MKDSLREGEEVEKEDKCRGITLTYILRQPECMLGAVATLWSKQTQAVALQTFKLEMKEA